MCIGCILYKFFFKAAITHSLGNLNPAERIRNFLDSRTGPVRRAWLVTFSAIRQQSHDADYTEELTVSGLTSGQEIRGSELRNFLGKGFDVIPVTYHTKTRNQLVQSHFSQTERKSSGLFGMSLRVDYIGNRIERLVT